MAPHKSSTSTTCTSNEEWYTPIDQIAPLVEKVRAVAVSRKTHDIEWRRSQLHAIQKILKENATELAEALHADMGQPRHFAELCELSGLDKQAQFALDHLDEWTKPQGVPTPFPTNLTQPVYSEIQYYPRGLVLIMTPWNFPIFLVLSPLIQAIAAGNCCVVKPSELSTHSSRLVSQLIGQYLDTEAIAVVQGTAAHATELLQKHRWDAISYTGGLPVAKIVAAAAALTLTPLLLELGGKSPAIVCEDAHVDAAAMRIAWGKFAGNCGQFCITTDYILVVKSQKDKLIAKLKEELVEFYGEDPQLSPDYGRMISVSHAKRVVGLIDNTCQIIHGKSRHDIENRYVEPTIVEATADSTIMQEEIFGPVLAVITVESTEEAIDFVNKNFNSKNYHPLALYVFSTSERRQRQVRDNITSGMCCVNHTCFQGANFHLPFGGVGYSGLGASIGKHGFDFFSHLRGTLVVNNHSSSRLDPGNWIICPPYNKSKTSVLQFMSKIPAFLEILRKAFKVALPVFVGMILYQYPNQVREFNLNTIIGWVESIPLFAS